MSERSGYRILDIKKVGAERISDSVFKKMLEHSGFQDFEFSKNTGFDSIYQSEIQSLL